MAGTLVQAIVAACMLAGASAFGDRDFAAAERAFSDALAADPSERAARFNLGKVYESTARLDDALAMYGELVRSRDADVESWVRIGIVHYVRSCLPDALAAFAAALRSDPTHPVAAINFGIAATDVGAYDDAVRVLRVAVEAHPARGDLGAALAEALRQAGDGLGAARAARAVVVRDPGNVEALLVLGHLAYDAGAFDDARTAFAAAGAAAPGRFEPPMNLAVLEHGLGRVDAALAAAERAVALAPGSAEAHVNLGMTQLLAGDLGSGFANVEWRHAVPGAGGRHAEFAAAGVAPWDGRSLDGGTVLVTRDQGLGDFVLWSRLFGAARERGVRLAVECPAALVPLYRDHPSVERASPAEVAAVAAFVPLCSLPHVLDIRGPAVPAGFPYLTAPPAGVAAYRTARKRWDARRAIGIAWAGDPTHRLDRFRSCPLIHFGTLADVPGVAWVSLQAGERGNDAPPRGFALRTFDRPLADFGETAAAIVALDGVITVDTAVAHVAGALGVPVWTLHGFGHYWLWGVERADSPWYPTMRHFRQREPGRWEGVFDDVRSALLA
jgi:tetratricopeptide (TPR) repeat protein